MSDPTSYNPRASLAPALNYLAESPAVAGSSVLSPRAVTASDPKWLQDIDKGLLTELDLEPLYASKKGNIYEDGGLPLPLLEKLTHLLETDTVLQKLSLRRCNIADPGAAFFAFARGPVFVP